MKQACITGLIVLLFFITSKGQPQMVQTVIDSLEKIVASNPNKDILKIRQLNELATAYLFNYQYTQGLQTAQKARKLALDISYPRGEGLYLRRIAAFHQGSPRSIIYDIKTRWFNEQAGFQEEKQELLQVSYYSNLRGPKNFDLALEGLRKAEEQFSRLGEKELLAHVLFSLSHHYYSAGLFSQGVEYIDKCAQLIEQLGHNEMLIYAKSGQVIYYTKIKKYQQAANYELEVFRLMSKIGNKAELALARYILGRQYWGINRFSSAIDQFLLCEESLLELRDTYTLVRLYEIMCQVYDSQGYSLKSISYIDKALSLRKGMDSPNDEGLMLALRGRNLTNLGRLEEAQREFDRVLELDRKRNNKGGIMYVLTELGQLELKKGNANAALSYLNRANDDYYTVQSVRKGYCQYAIAQCYQQLGELSRAIAYATQCYEWSRNFDWLELKLKSSLLLSELYEQSGKNREALHFLKTHNLWKTEMQEQDNTYRLVDIETRSIQRKSQQEKARLQAETLKKEEENRRQRLWLLMVAGALVSSVGLATLLYRSNRSKQKSNTLLQRQRDEISQQRLQLQNSLEELRSTQTQLIQKEKLASLGELTAGIAHEIQNPLNFVNNYSEVNMELIEELQEEAEKGDTEEIKALLTDLSDNERKIHHHGRRADAIVRGMLEHARATPGEKVPTDLNALADEYLRLAYHGLRAKDPDFQCELVTDFDPNIGKVEVAPSELGRVLLNLFNNAFYAVRQRAMLVADQAYTPTVWVSTTKLPLLQGEGRGEVEGGGRRYGEVTIKVRDNGTGMPGEVKAKIFQPFFTTKPTGEGTGLGLSLSYDIVTKGHGGALRVESMPGEGTEFVVELPV